MKKSTVQKYVYNIFSFELKMRCGIRIYISICMDGVQRNAEESTNPVCECMCACWEV